MAIVLLTREIKKTFLVLFREMFAVDDDFTYNKDIKNSKIIISTKFERNDAENKLPQIVISTASYIAAGEDTLNQGFYQEVYNLSKVQTGRKYIKTVNFQVTVDVLSPVKAECEIVADKVFNIVNHEGAELLYTEGFFIKGLSVSEPTFKEQYPQNTFTSPVTIQGECRITWTVTPTTPTMFNKFKAALNIEKYGSNPYQIIT